MCYTSLMENITELFIYLLVFGLTIAGMWKVFEKTGQAGWKSIIPIYNMVILTRIIKKPWWWALLMLIPYIGVIWSIWATNLLSKSFGKDFLYTIGLVILPFIFYPLLGFGKAPYSEPFSPIDEDADVFEDIEEPVKPSESK